MFSLSRRSGLCSGILPLISLIGLLSLEGCRDPMGEASRPVAQDSVVLAVPTLTHTVEVKPAMIALGDTATVRVTLVNRSTTPVTLTLPCWPMLGYVIETPEGELAPWLSPVLCPGAMVPMRFAAGEVREVQFQLPRLEREPAAVSPGEYRVRATFGELRSDPVPFVIAHGR